MDAIHQLEIIWILILQNLSGWLAEPMRLLSLLGQEEFFMLAMPALFWSLDAALGIRVGIMLLLSNEINCIAKLAFFSPRPYWVDLRVKALSSETSFGMPSGHAENAASIWGLIAVSTRETWGKVLLVVLVLLIGFSRIVLGMHFISDVLVGWLLGGLAVWIFIQLERPMTKWLRSRTLNEMLALAFASAIGLVALVLLTSAVVGSGPVPAVWVQNALAATPDVPIAPLEISSAFTIGGTWFGFLAGYAWLFCRKGGFNADGTPSQRLLRYVVGAVGVFILYYGLGKVFPRNPDVLSYSLRFIRYTLIGVWISALAPLVFERLGLVRLAQKEEFPPLSAH